jgi:hypothetical protein
VADELAKLKQVLGAHGNIWSGGALNDVSLRAMLDASGGSAALLALHAPNLESAGREFGSTDEMCAWLRYAASTSSPPLSHHANPALEPLFALLSDPSCTVLTSPSEVTSLRHSAAVDSLVACCAEGGASELVTLVQRLHALKRSFASVAELSVAVAQAAEEGFFLPRALLSRILDFVKKSNLFGTGATKSLPDLDAELIDSLVASMREPTAAMTTLEHQTDRALDCLRTLEQQGRTFTSWEDLCQAAVASLTQKPAASAAAPAAAAASASASAPIAAAAAAAGGGDASSSSMDAASKSRLMTLLNDDDFSLFDDMSDELVITAASLDALLAAAGPHGFDGLLHILSGLNGIGRRADSFDHLIQLVGEVVLDGAYSSRSDRAKILDFLSDDRQCRLFVMGAASTLPDSAQAFLRATPPANLDALILGVGGSAHVDSLLAHCHALDRVGSRLENIEDILPALQVALDPAQGNGSYVGTKERRELVSLLAGNEADKLLPRDGCADRATLENSLREQSALLDSVYALANETALLMQRASENKPLGFLFSPSARGGGGGGGDEEEGDGGDGEAEEEAEEKHLPETASELVLDQLEQMNNSAAAAAVPRFEDLPALLQGLKDTIEQLKAHTQAEETRKAQMLKRLNRGSANSSNAH